MAEILAGVFLLLMVAALFLHVLSLPANWVILALLALFKLIRPEASLSWTMFLLLALLAGAAEVVEFAAQAFGAKRFGASGKGNLGGVIGAVAGAILGAPLFFGLGALPGALLGAYGGCLLFEKLHGRDWAESGRAAWGAMWGKFFGLTAKVGFGVLILSLAVPRIWPD
ncbi:MAG: DUF456 domain-containing protein [Thermodesulfobacteriota bacterium]